MFTKFARSLSALVLTLGVATVVLPVATDLSDDLANLLSFSAPAHPDCCRGPIQP